MTLSRIENLRHHLMALGGFWNLLDFLVTPGGVMSELLAEGDLVAASQTSHQGWRSCLDTLVVERRARFEAKELNYLMGLPSPDWFELEEAWDREAQEAHGAQEALELEEAHEFAAWGTQTHFWFSDSD